MSDWRPIETAPKERWIYVWQSDLARDRARMTGWELDIDGPYAPHVCRWDGERWFVDRDGSRIKGGDSLARASRPAWSKVMRPLSDGERSILAQDGPEDDREPWRVLAERRYRARKAHECDGCLGTCFAQHIRPGEAYTVLCVIEDGEFKVLRLCNGVYDGRH